MHYLFGDGVILRLHWSRVCVGSVTDDVNKYVEKTGTIASSLFWNTIFILY